MKSINFASNICILLPVELLRPSCPNVADATPLLSKHNEKALFDYLCILSINLHLSINSKLIFLHMLIKLIFGHMAQYPPLTNNIIEMVAPILFRVLSCVKHSFSSVYSMEEVFKCYPFIKPGNRECKTSHFVHSEWFAMH